MPLRAAKPLQAMQRAVEPNDEQKRDQEQYHACKVVQEARSAYGRPGCPLGGRRCPSLLRLDSCVPAQIAIARTTVPSVCSDGLPLSVGRLSGLGGYKVAKPATIGAHVQNAARYPVVVEPWVPSFRELGLFKTLGIRGLQRALRPLSVLVCAAVPLGLFVGGAQPVAVGLFPAPWDKLAHAGVFCLLATAIGYASGFRGKPMWWLAVLGAATIGALDEWHQTVLPGRSAGWDDLVADAVGGAMGASGLLYGSDLRRWLRACVFKHR